MIRPTTTCRRRRPALTAWPSSTRRPAGPPTTSSPSARGIARRRSKVGHAGTLDPDATGVLLLGVGARDPPAALPDRLPKTLHGEVVLGVETSTLDAAGEVTATHDMDGSTIDDGAAGRGHADRRHPAGAADGVGGEGRRAPPARAGPRGHRGRAGAAARDRPPVRRRADRRIRWCIAVEVRVLVGHLRPVAGRRSRSRARRRRPPAQSAAHGDRLVHPRRGPPARGRPAGVLTPAAALRDYDSSR